LNTFSLVDFKAFFLVVTSNQWRHYGPHPGV